MQGLIVAYDSGIKAGVIKGSDNRVYYFTIEEWDAADAPEEGKAVLFEPGPWRDCQVNTIKKCRPASKAA